jgi:hypothetical protein
MVLWQNAKKHQNCVDGGATDHHQFGRHQSYNPSNIMLIIRNNSNLGVYNSEFQGESEYQFYFSIGLMVLWQIDKKHQNCVGGGGTCWLQITTLNRHQSSNPPTTMLIMKKNSNIGVYDSELSDYQLCFSIGAMILWQNAKNTRNHGLRPASGGRWMPPI